MRIERKQLRAFLARLAPAARLILRVMPYALALAFIVRVACVTAGHEMWRDEIQAWLIVRDAATPLEVLYNTRYEGHPWLWHMLLWAVSRLTRNPVAMQVLHVAIAGVTAFVILRWAPFPLPLRILLIGGYFFSYEWGVIARNYSISALLLCAFAALYARRWRTTPWMGLALAAACLTNIHAIILVLALTPALAVEYAVAYAGGLREARKFLPSALLGLALALGGLGIGISATKPPEDSGFATGWHFRWNDGRYATAADCVIRAYAPLPVDQPNFWNTNRLLDEGRSPAENRAWWGVPPEARIYVAWAILLAGALIMFRRPWPMVPYLTGSIGLVAFFYTKYMGGMQHHGFLFLMFVITWWMSRHNNPWRLPWGRVDRIPAIMEHVLLWLLVPLLALHVWGAYTAAQYDRTTVFSQGRAASERLRELYPDRDAVTWAGHASPAASTVVGYLQLPRIFYPDRGEFGSFVIWDKARLGSTEQTILKRIGALQQEERKPVVIVSSRRMTTRTAYRNLSFIESFEGSISGESYYIYEWPWSEPDTEPSPQE